MSDRRARQQRADKGRVRFLVALLLTLFLGAWGLEMFSDPPGLDSARGIGAGERFYHFDFLNFYTAFQTFIQHGEPYTQTLQQRLFEEAIAARYPHKLNFLYPPLLLPLLTPVSMLSFSVASVVWLLSSILVTALMLVVATEDIHSYRLRTLSLVLGLTFAPFLSALYWGQLIPFVVVLLFFSVRSFLEQRTVRAGLLVALALVKPQLCALPFFAMCFLAWRRGDFVRFLTAVCVVLVTLSTGTELVVPGLHQQWIESISYVEAHAQRSLTPTIIGLTRLLFQSAEATPLMIFAGISCAGSLLLLITAIARWQRERRELELLNLSLLFATLVAPYAWFQDQTLLLIPALMVLGSWDERRAFYLSLGFFLLSLLATIFGQALGLPQHYFVLFQLACISLYLLAMIKEGADLASSD